VREADRVFTRVWQFEVVGGREAEFEQVYAADGAWARLFARSEGFLGTELFQSLSEPARFLTVDRFTSAEDFERLLEKHASSYAALDAQSQALTVSEQEIATGIQP
jgi:heme-degrading monooxygenase HmoA